jgi:hypothetical protein
MSDYSGSGSGGSRRRRPMKANPVRGHALVIKHGVRGVLAILASMALVTALAVSAYAAPPRYRFTKVADSARDGFDPFRFE